MKVRLLAFASAADAVGAAESVLELDDGASVGELRRLLERRYPALGPLWERLAVAVDGEVARPDQVLTDGCEVALLPPVSGGSSSPRARLVDGEIDLAMLEREMADAGSGALLVFLGRPRDRTGDRAVLRLVYQAYRTMAEAALERIAADLEAATDGLRLRIVHRLGTVEIGRPSVAIAVSSPHRDAAYRASREALERLKREVPIWKQEIYRDGESSWREVEPLAGPVTARSGRGNGS
jgi:molybdopterin synthase catalytic subunit